MSTTVEEFRDQDGGVVTDADILTSEQIGRRLAVALPFIKRAQDYMKANPERMSTDSMLFNDAVNATDEERQAAFELFKHDMYVTMYRADVESQTASTH